MPSDIESPAGSSSKKSDLSSGPPLPPSANKPAKQSLMGMMGGDQGNPLGQLGQSAADPLIQTMAGMKAIEQGISMLSSNNPGLSPILGQVLQAIQQAVVQNTMSGSVPPGGMMPPPPPPGPLPPGLAPGATPQIPSPIPAGV